MTFEREVREHIDTINKEMGEIEKKMGKIETNVSWLMKFFWIIAASSIGTLIAELMKFIK